MLGQRGMGEEAREGAREGAGEGKLLHKTDS